MAKPSAGLRAQPALGPACRAVTACASSGYKLLIGGLDISWSSGFSLRGLTFVVAFLLQCPSAACSACHVQLRRDQFYSNRCPPELQQLN